MVKKIHPPVKMGSSGFEYVMIDGRVGGAGMGGSKAQTVTATVKNIKTKETTALISSKTVHYKGRSSKTSTGSQKFYGTDSRYYYITIKKTKVDWGQVQSDGSVIRPNRSVMTVIDFYPLYIKTAPVIVPTKHTTDRKKVSTPPVVVSSRQAETISTAMPAVVTLSQKNNIQTENVKEVSWITKILQWLIKILNR